MVAHRSEGATLAEGCAGEGGGGGGERGRRGEEGGGRGGGGGRMESGVWGGVSGTEVGGWFFSP